jgi:membrane protein required for colicin V production
MLFSILDIVLVLILLGFAWKGYKQGLIEALSSLLAIMIGLYAAYRFYGTGAWWLSHWTGWGQTFSRILVFIIIFIAINWLVNYLCYLADRFFQLIFKLPFVRTLNKILGALFAILEGIIILVVLIFIFKSIPVSTTLTQAVNTSLVATYLVKIASFIWPFLPKLAKNLL